MNKYIILIFVIIIGVLGYILGNYLPIKMLNPTLTSINFTLGEYYRLVVAIVSAFMTLLAVIVALFKDDFRELWKRPKIEFCEPTQMTIEDTSSSENSETENDTIKAQRYLSRIEVYNRGNLPALNSEIYLEKLEFTPIDSTIAQAIESSSSALEWNGYESNSIAIPPGGKKLIEIVKITAPVKLTTPDSDDPKEPSKLIIGNITNKKEHAKGKWTATFTLYAQNIKPISFEIEIEWNGVWKNRLTEFNQIYKIVKKS